MGVLLEAYMKDKQCSISCFIVSNSTMPIEKLHKTVVQ